MTNNRKKAEVEIFIEERVEFLFGRRQLTRKEVVEELKEYKELFIAKINEKIKKYEN
jgi:hypothetical protein